MILKTLADIKNVTVETMASCTNESNCDNHYQVQSRTICYISEFDYVSNDVDTLQQRILQFNKQCSKSTLVILRIPAAVHTTMFTRLQVFAVTCDIPVLPVVNEAQAAKFIAKLACQKRDTKFNKRDTQHYNLDKAMVTSVSKVPAISTAKATEILQEAESIRALATLSEKELMRQFKFGNGKAHKMTKFFLGDVVYHRLKQLQEG
jgi:ERCC4-type nuclease